jgi:hypothetical protein
VAIAIKLFFAAQLMIWHNKLERFAVTKTFSAEFNVCG